jgi:hypothetical protein
MHEFFFFFCWQHFHGLLLEDNIVFCKPLSRGFSRAVFWNQLLGELVSNEAFRQFIVVSVHHRLRVQCLEGLPTSLSLTVKQEKWLMCLSHLHVGLIWR